MVDDVAWFVLAFACFMLPSGSFLFWVGRWARERRCRHRLLLFVMLAFMLRLVSGGSSNSGAPSSLYEFPRGSIYCHNCDLGYQLECMEFWSKPVVWDTPGIYGSKCDLLLLSVTTYLMNYYFVSWLTWCALPTIIPAVKLPRRLWFDMSRPMRIRTGT